MKRFLLLACAFLFFVQISILSGCGNNDGIKIDPNKKQVYVSVWNGGYGYEWLQLTVDEFNKDNQETQFIILPNKDYVHNISEALVAGSSSCDIFFTASSDIQDILPLGILMDLTDVMSMKPDGESGETILKKMDNADLFNQVYSYADKVYNRHFWCRGYYVDTVGRNKEKIAKYIQNQVEEDKYTEQISMKEYIDPFTGEQVKKDK